MVAILCAVFLLSGAAGLIFETLWFRQSGLAFGNGVWASSLVLSSFMGGLAVGNGLAARFAARLRRPLRAYAWLELAIGVTGVALVAVLPALGSGLAPWLRALEGDLFALNAVRLGLAFALLLVPASAMGATLPILVHALRRRDPSFGSLLGRLYGWNTVGAVCGTLAGELWLIERLGIFGTGLAAAGMNALAALVALFIVRRIDESKVEGAKASPPPRPRISFVAWRSLLAAFLLGWILLALEVVWFRFLHLFVHSGSRDFALMLASVLAGIGLGGFAGAAWLRRRPDAYTRAPELAMAAGVFVALGYAGYGLPVAWLGRVYAQTPELVLIYVTVRTFPVSFLSGVLFPLVATSLQRELGGEARSAGVAVLANTLGAGLGSLAAGFVLLPWLGMERSLLVLAALYGGVTLVLMGFSPRKSATPRGRLLDAVLVVILGALLVFFPTGLLESRYLPLLAARGHPDEPVRVVAYREGRTETVLYLQRDFLGEPYYQQMLTDGISMSATAASARRYMKLYVYWAVALRPDPKSALLISYGIGSTAKALTDTKSLERIDVVDISREVLEMSDLVYEDAAQHPLRDPRVRVHVEDGRYFLQTSDERYDLITGEPPPPKTAGVVNLYSREYFQLVHDRLREGGVATYWLPVHSLLYRDSLAIIRAWCDVFEDCALWAGNDLDWMLTGTRGAGFARDEARFRAQWDDPVVGPELRATGLELPEQFGALFLADAPFLRQLTAQTAPLVDDWPKRVADEPALHTASWWRPYRFLMETSAVRERFRTSAFVAAAWPPALREATLPYFEVQRLLTPGQRREDRREQPLRHLAELHAVLSTTPLRTAPRWMLGTDQARAEIAARVAGDPPEGEAAYHLGLAALADRDWSTASERLLGIPDAAAIDAFAPLYTVYAACMAGREAEAAELARASLSGFRKAGPAFCARLLRRLEGEATEPSR